MTHNNKDNTKNEQQFKIDPSRDYFDESSSLFYTKEKQERAAVQYQELIQFAKDEDDIYGVVVAGSRGKGLAHQYSDYDMGIVVDPDKLDYYKEIVLSDTYADLGDAGVISIERVREGYPYPHWARYGLARIDPPVDKTGEITKILEQYVSIPADKQEEVIRGNLSAYVNGIYRSIKSERSGDSFSSHFMCITSVRHLLVLIFGIHGRETPYPKYLFWEAENYPLHKLENLEYNPIDSIDFMEMIEQLLKTADVRIQQRIFYAIYELIYAEGYGSDLEDEWGEDHIRLIQYYSPNSTK